MNGSILREQNIHKLALLLGVDVLWLRKLLHYGRIEWTLIGETAQVRIRLEQSPNRVAQFHDSWHDLAEVLCEGRRRDFMNGWRVEGENQTCRIEPISILIS